ncbi:uncharacterized protein LOC141718568 [Apium graveolens]|uniref:uncharacterized protein LOC141718568 n=1 Tax=Apium graveolens TaxID=4045 RepID=UPI003D7995A1
MFNSRDANLILTIPIRSSQADTWYWRKEKMGHYSVKSAYAALIEQRGLQVSSANSGFWRKLWNLKIPLKIKHFLWRASSDVLPTKEQLRAKRVEDAQDKSFDLSFGFMNQSDGVVQWKQPIEDKVKVNTDAALFEDSGQYSFAMVARDHKGDMLEARTCCKQGTVTPEMAEAIGVKEALSWVKNKGWTNVVMESDCLLLIQAIRCSSVHLSYFDTVVKECKKLLCDLGDRNVILNFVKRSANKVAHYLARHTSSLADRTWNQGEINPEFQLVLFEDLKY